jgi:hypothetical protein
MFQKTVWLPGRVCANALSPCLFHKLARILTVAPGTTIKRNIAFGSKELPALAFQKVYFGRFCHGRVSSHCLTCRQFHVGKRYAAHPRRGVWKIRRLSHTGLLSRTGSAGGKTIQAHLLVLKSEQSQAFFPVAERGAIVGALAGASRCSRGRSICFNRSDT